MITGLDHVGIAVADLEKSLDTFRRLFSIDEAAIHRERVEEQGVEIASFTVGNIRIELLAPLSEQSPVAKFLAKRGEGIHHLSFATTDIRQDLHTLEQQGFRLVDAEPRSGAHQMWIAFLHPKSTNGVLIELCQPKNEDTDRQSLD